MKPDKSRATNPDILFALYSLAAIDHFYEFLGLGKPTVRREELPQQAPGALSPEDQKRFLRAVERTASSRDQALALLLFYTGIRIGECVALDVDDLLLSARRSQVIVRSGKGDSYWEIPLNRCRTTRHFFRAH